jgi:pilus assembly protein CpaB
MSTKHGAAKAGALGFAAVALACAALAAYLVGHLLTQKGYASEPTRPVVVAKRALAPAEPLTPDALEVVKWPQSAVPDGAIATVEELFAGGKAPVPSAAILKGEPIVPARLATQAQGTGIAALLRPGYRAVAVKIDDAVGRAGLVYPGAHVDVMATIRDPEGRGPSTRIAVQDARVLAVESETDVALRKPRKADGPADRPAGLDGTVVTLEVLPGEAEIVSLAVREGQVDLALRNGGDDRPADTRGATPLGFSAFAPPPAGAASAPVAQLTTPAAEAAAAASTKRPSSSSGGHRHIEIRASDVPDGPSGGATAPTATVSGGIETYRAH